MSEREPDLLTDAERRAQHAVRALPRVAASADLRARLRGAFVAGRLAGRADDVVDDAAGTTGEFAGDARDDLTGATPRHPRPGLRAVPRPRRAWAPVASWAALAAAFVIVMVMNRGPRWDVMSVQGDGIAVVDQRAIPLTHPDQLARALHPGARVQTPPGTTVDLIAGNTMMMEVMGGTELVVPRTPGLWFARRAVADVRNGEVRFTTGAAFHGARLAVSTPEAQVLVTGTTLAVIRDTAGTCVCVFEGRVMVGPHRGTMIPIESGYRRYMYADGRAPIVDHMLPQEHEPLGEVRARFSHGANRPR